jgi:glycerol kinase
MSYILAFDQGTTSSRSIIFDQNGEIVSLAQSAVRQIYPQSGWVEHDPKEIVSTQIQTAIDALRNARISAKDIAGVGVTNQRETAVVWDRNTGEPVYNAIVWQDRRTSEFCDQVRKDYNELIRTKTGLEVDAYFSASKIRWLLDNVPEASSKAKNGELAFGTIDTWLIWNLTYGKLHITDPSDASRTMLFDIQTLEWDAELMDIFGIPKALLPEVRPSSEIYGEIELKGQLNGIKIAAIAGDQQAALFGQGCFEAGDAKCTYGTGCFLLQNTGASPAPSKHRLLTTIGWSIGDETEYALEGSVFIGGAVVQWLRDALEVIERSSDVEELASSVTDNGGVYFVPAFVGLGTPHWDQDARGTIVGLTRGTGKAHIARAALESIAFQTADLLTAMNSDSNSDLKELRVDGGATENELLLQFQADILQMPIARSKIAETTALGAAYLAGLATGFWLSKKELSRQWQADKVFSPEISETDAKHLTDRWHEAIQRSLRWVAK